MFRAMLLRLPVHARGALVEHLHAIAADVALSRLRIFRNHHRPGDVAPAVLRPALQNRKIDRARNPSSRTTSWHSPLRTVFGKNDPELGQLRQHLHFFEKSLRRLHVEKRVNALGDLIERVHFQRQIHAPLGAHQIRHRRESASPAAARKAAPARPAFTARSDNLRDFEDRIHFGRNALQLVLLFQLAQKIAQVSIRHFPSWNRLRYGQRDPQL